VAQKFFKNMEGIVASAPGVFLPSTPLAIAHFMAQASEECGQGLEMVENMNYGDPLPHQEQFVLPPNSGWQGN
jgi:hypothetical protein